MGKKLKRNQQNSYASGEEKKNRAFYDEEYIKRAEAMERELFGDEDPEAGDDFSEEEEVASYERLIRQLKAEGVYQEDETDGETDKKFGRKSSKAAYRGGVIRRCLSRAAIIVLLCSACIFTVSMTSEANRNYFVEKIQYMMGDDTKIIADNDKRNELPNKTEQEAVKEIEAALEVDVPEFYYRPYGLEFMNYYVDSLTGIAKIEYLYNKNIVSLVVDKQDEDTASRTTAINGNEDSFIVNGMNGISVIVEEIQEKQDIIPSYTALWEKDNVMYWFTGKIEKEEIIKLFEQMIY